MATTVKLKRSETGSSIPTTSDIAVGEVALNTADQKIYVRDSSDNIKIVGVGADATASVKGVASFSSSNFTVSSGAVSLNADQSGTITGVGTISTGVWNGTVIGSQYGGTGQNFSSSTGVTYFDSGTASVVSMATKGQLLVGDGSGAPQALSVGTNDYVLTADSTTGTGLAWKEAASGGGGSASKNMFFFTATSGQTTFSGNDDDSSTLAYTAGTGATNIYLNGVLLDDSDYTASNGTSVVLSSAAAANDILTVEAFIISSTFELSNDSSPQLGGNLDVNGNKIVSTSNADIDIEPNGTGNVLLGNFKFNADQSVGAGQDDYVLTYDNSSGTISLEAASGGDVVEDTTPQLGGDLDLNSNNITGTGAISCSGDLTVDTSTLKVDSTNNRVGIGTASPANLLEVENTGGDAGVNISAANTGVSYINFKDTNDPDVGQIAYYHSDNSMRFKTNDAEDMRLESDGDLHVDGDVIAFSTTISDVALKSDIEVIPNALEKVKQINGVTFKRHDGREGAGVIAQELEKVLPQSVREKVLYLHKDDGKKYKTVEYDSIHGLLIEAIKELSNKIEKMEDK